jgi:hypothetical protein
MVQSNGKELYLYMEKYQLLKSLPVYEVSNFGNVRRIGFEQPLKPAIQNGYLALSLYMNNKQYKRYVHRLVAEVFIGDCKNKTINHMDGDKLNNTLQNLEIVSHSENNQHAYSTGLRVFTENQRLGLLQSRQKKVIDIETGVCFDSLADACKSLNENYTAIRKRIMRKSKNVRFQYI